MSSDDLKKITSSESSPQDSQIEQLEDDLQAERNARNEERFIWILAVIILFDVLWFSNMETWGGPIAVLVLELFMLLILADRFGVDRLEPWIDKFLGAISNDKKRD